MRVRQRKCQLAYLGFDIVSSSAAAIVTGTGKTVKAAEVIQVRQLRGSIASDSSQAASAVAVMFIHVGDMTPSTLEPKKTYGVGVVKVTVEVGGKITIPVSETNPVCFNNKKRMTNQLVL